MFQFLLTFFLFMFINSIYKKYYFFLMFLLIMYNMFMNYTYTFFYNLFFFDWYNLMFMLILLLIGMLIMYYSKWYFVDEPKKLIFYLYMGLFMFFMFLFFSFNSVLCMLVGWEGIGMMSYLLINWWCGRSEAGVAGQQAVMYNRIGDFFIYLFIFVCFNNMFLFNWKNYGMYFIMMFFMISMMSKSSLFFFHPWLPNAMEGPTPVSSLLHSSTMVVAGVFLYIRFINMFNDNLINLMGTIGGLTMLYGGICSLGSSDFKKIIAYSTTSQLGFMILIVSFLGSFYGMIFLIYHAFFKSLLFLMSGLFIHESNGFQFMNKMNMLNSKMSSVMYTFSVMSLMGFPFFSGFFSKDLMLENIWGEVFNCFLIMIFVFGCSFTIAYCFKLMKINTNFSPKIINMLENKNLFIFLFISMMLIMNSNFFFVFIFKESYLSFYTKMMMLIIFFIGYFLFMKKNNFINVVMYNPLVHRFVMLGLLNFLKKAILMEYKLFEMRVLVKNLPIFYGFKILFSLVLFFYLMMVIL
nr:NADH dehydrogenase subunit 5 [Didemnum perlucidum]